MDVSKIQGPGEPSFYVIVDERGHAEFVVNLPHEAQEYINDACDLGVEGAGKWRSVPVFDDPVMSSVSISNGEVDALRRFHECVTDGEGWDVPKPMMQRLAKIGLVRRVTANIYEHTEFGLVVLDEMPANPVPSDMLAALQAILPFCAKTSASEGGAAKYSASVAAADLVRAAIAKATGSAK